MKEVIGEEERLAMDFIMKAVEVARNSTCDRAKCGSIIVKGGEIIGSGFNSPPGNLAEQKRCACSKELYHQKVTDKTCCVHAEQRAIMDTLQKNPDKIRGSRLYFIRLDKNGSPSRSGKPYCTHCSKLALDTGIKEFVLWQEKGICIYDTDEYNTISFQYKE